MTRDEAFVAVRWVIADLDLKKEDGEKLHAAIVAFGDACANEERWRISDELLKHIGEIRYGGR